MKNPTEFKNIIFDFGGVLMDLDVSRSKAAFQRLVADGFNIPKSFGADFFLNFELGKIPASDFRDSLRKVLGDHRLSDHSIDQAWNAMLGGIPEDRLALLEDLKKTRRIFLLSNTNRIHHDCFAATMAGVSGSAAEFENLFEGVYYSYKMGLRKPNPEIFNAVIAQHSLRCEDTLFVDDSLENVEAARGVGLGGYHLQGQLLEAGLI